jgi:hypothetical protein
MVYISISTEATYSTKQIFLGMPRDVQLHKKFPAYYGIPRFTAAFTISLPPLISILRHISCKAVIYNVDFIAPPVFV